MDEVLRFRFHYRFQEYHQGGQVAHRVGEDGYYVAYKMLDEIVRARVLASVEKVRSCLLYTSPSPRDRS